MSVRLCLEEDTRGDSQDADKMKAQLESFLLGT